MATELPKLTNDKCDELKQKIVGFLKDGNYPTTECKVYIYDARDWSVEMTIPSAGIDEAAIEIAMENFLQKLGTHPDRNLFCHEDKKNHCFEWFFNHPDTPKSVLKFQDDRAERGRREEEEKKRKAYEEYLAQRFEDGVIIKPSRSKSQNNTAYIVMSEEWYDEIESGEKTVEYRNYTEYYVDKFLSHKVKYVKMSRTYGHAGKPKPPQMVWEIENIFLCDDCGDEIPAYRKDGTLTGAKDLPKGYLPAMLAIHLGKRIS